MAIRFVIHMTPIRSAMPAAIEIILPSWLGRYRATVMPETVKNSAIAFMTALTGSLLQATMAREANMETAVPE